MEFVILETFENYIDASLTLGRLQEAGIQGWLKDEHTATINPILTNAIGGIKLMVPKHHADEAVEILNALKKLKRESFTCPYCGSHNIEYINTPKLKNWFSSVLTWMLSSYAIGVEQTWHCFDCSKEFKEPLGLRNEISFEE